MSEVGGILVLGKNKGRVCVEAEAPAKRRDVRKALKIKRNKIGRVA